MLPDEVQIDAEFLKKDCDVFASRFLPFLMENNFIKKLATKKRITIVSLGCSVPTDGLAIKLIWDRLLQARVVNNNFQYIGMDIERDKLNYLTEYLNENYDGKKWASFFEVDATNFTAVQEKLPNKKADIVILRHPIFCHAVQGDLSDAVTETLPAILSQGGGVFATFYDKRELNLFKGLLKLSPSIISKRMEVDKFPVLKTWHPDSEPTITLNDYRDCYCFFIQNWQRKNINALETEYTHSSPALVSDTRSQVTQSTPNNPALVTTTHHQETNSVHNSGNRYAWFAGAVGVASVVAYYALPAALQYFSSEEESAAGPTRGFGI